MLPLFFTVHNKKTLCYQLVYIIEIQRLQIKFTNPRNDVITGTGAAYTAGSGETYSTTGAGCSVAYCWRWSDVLHHRSCCGIHCRSWRNVLHDSLPLALERCTQRLALVRHTQRALAQHNLPLELEKRTPPQVLVRQAQSENNKQPLVLRLCCVNHWSSILHGVLRHQYAAVAEPSGMPSLFKSTPVTVIMGAWEAKP